MSLLKSIITNDIKDILGHKPSSAEYKSALDYLDKYIDDKTMLVDVEVILRDWRSDCCKRCEQCGEYFLTELMEEHWIGNGYQFVCSAECAVELRREFE